MTGFYYYHNSTKVYIKIFLLFRSLILTKAFTWKNGVELKQISESSRKRQFSDLCCLPLVRDAKTNLS